MDIAFRPNSLSAWIGSLPLTDHEEAVRLMMEYTPDIPIWIQLPHNKNEGMVDQFAPGMPGLVRSGDRLHVNTRSDTFDDEMLAFFEDYMAVVEDFSNVSNSRFEISTDIAPGFYKFMHALDSLTVLPTALKGQVTGPFTFATGLVDEDRRAVFYNDQLRDAAVKLIAMKARWQVYQLRKYKIPVIIFLDEPALAGFGSSAFISVSREAIDAALGEVMTAIKEEGGLTGIHVCANTEWPVILDSAADIVSFDAYSYFDKFAIYKEQVVRFLKRGGMMAWGIVPTGSIEAIERESVDSLYALWEKCAAQIQAMGIPREMLIAQSLITPSCGAGSLSLPHAEKVIRMNRDVSRRIRGI
jgi:methionine synthase II (cobalamin-independent)